MFTHSTKFPYARIYYFESFDEAVKFKEFWEGRGTLRTRKNDVTTGYITLL